jgi:hypothetical protein
MAKKNKQAKKMAAKGKSAAQIKAKTGVGSAFAKRYAAKAAPKANDQGPPGNTASRVNPGISATPSRTTPEIKGVGQGLRIAGGDGLSKGELKTISDVSGKDPGKIIGKLDKINEKLAGKDKTGITLRSGAANMLIKKAGKSTPKSRGYKPVDFGSGAIGSALMGMMGDSGSPGTWFQGQKQGVREAVEPTFLAKGMDLGPKGKETVRGVGKQYKVPKRFTGDTTVDDTAAGDTTASDTAVDTTAADTMAEEPIIPEPEPVDTSLSSGAGGLDLASWATGFKKARSARQKAGKGAQGLASQKKSPFKSWNA